MAVVNHFLAIASFLSLISFSALFHPVHSKPNGFSLRLIPRDAPESPLYPGNLTQLERIERMIKFTKARDDYLDRISSANSTIELDDLTLTLLRDNFFYMVEVNIGTPPVTVFLLVDTGGGLIWTQCKPCVNCYPQRTPIFDLRQSNSYRTLPCSHPLCQGPSALYRCEKGQCLYDVSYGGGALTRGIASVETFTFSSTLTLDGIIFGCSKDNRNIQFGKNGVISGVMGLSLNPDSLLSQLPDQTQSRFSYCLIPSTRAQMDPSLISFGDNIPQPPEGLRTTPLSTPPGSHYYHLNLFDISVAGTKLQFPSDLFQPEQGGTRGFFIDSGALISQFDQNIHGRNVYMEVINAFQKYYDAFGLQRLGRVPEGLQLCYKYTPDFAQYASMTYHLQDADYEVDPLRVNLFNSDQGYFCVALSGGNGKSILGAWHQQDMRVIYDLSANKLQFAPERCR